MLSGVTHSEISEENRVCRVRLDTDTAAGDPVCRNIFRVCCEAGLSILEMTTQKASLEDIFMELTGVGEEYAV